MQGKIRNILTLPFLLAGLITGGCLDGWEGIQASLGGILLPFVLLFVLHWLRMLGAGDIKLFCAVGAVMGAGFVVYAMAWSFLAGGVIAAGILLVRKNGRKRFVYLLLYVKNCFFTLSLQPYTELQDKADGGKFPFAVAVFAGVLVQMGFEAEKFLC